MPFLGQVKTIGGQEKIFTEDGWIDVASQAPPPLPPKATTGIPKPKYDDYWEDNVGSPVALGTPGAIHNTRAFLDDIANWQEVTGNEPGKPGGVTPGSAGPTAAELEIARSQVQATNLSTFIQGTISELSLEIDAGRLETDQALQEFNRRLDAFAEAGRQFQGLLPFTIPRGAKYAPGFQPGGIGEQLGIKPRKAQVINIDPFQMAQDIVNQTPDLTQIGVPSGDALDEAVAIAKGFL